MTKRDSVWCSVRMRDDGSSEVFDPETGKVVFVIEAPIRSEVGEWQKPNPARIDAAFDRSTYQDPEAGLQ